MRRVVVTGMGMITAIGCGVNDNWKNLISSTSGIKLIDSFKIDDLSSKVGGTISDELIDNNFSDKEKRKMDKFILYSLIAAEEAIKNSGWIINDDNKASRSGVIVGSGIGGLSTIYDNSIFLITIFTWLMIIFFTRYVALGSVISLIIATIYSFIFLNGLFPFFIFMTLLITYKHKDNFERIRNKTEHKIFF